MASGDTIPDPDEGPLDRLLARSRHHATLPPEFEAGFESATSRKRAERIRIELAILAVISVVCLGLDARVPGALAATMPVRLGVVAPLLLLGSLLVAERRPIWVQGWATALPIFVLVVTTTWFGLRMSGVYADRYIMAAGILIFSVNLIVPLRYKHAVWLTAANIAAYIGLCLSGLGTQPLSRVADLVFFLAGISLLSLRTLQQLEAGNKNLFLFGLQACLQAEALAQANKRLTEIASTDPLTGVGNRRRFHEVLSSLRAATQETAEHVSMLLIDVDHFKRFNDSAGHPEGDECLRRVAATIVSEVGHNSAVVTRYGGEEFAVILPRAEEQQARTAGERIRNAIEQLAIPHPGFDDCRVVTVSVGAARASVGDMSGDPDAVSIVQKADEALYQAKRAGRNCVATADSSGLRVAPADGDVRSAA